MNKDQIPPPAEAQEGEPSLEDIVAGTETHGDRAMQERQQAQERALHEKIKPGDTVHFRGVQGEWVEGTFEGEDHENKALAQVTVKTESGSVPGGVPMRRLEEDNETYRQEAADKQRDIQGLAKGVGEFLG